MLTDTHCHLASSQFNGESLEEILARAGDTHVSRMVTLATSLRDLEANLTIANDSRVRACLGIHPCEVAEAPDDAVTILDGYIDDPRVCGIGETGLDYFHPAPVGWNETDYRRRQISFLRQHFELAVRANLNVVIHTRDREGNASFEDAFAIYQEFQSKIRAVFHCFSGSYEIATRVIRCGGLVSFGRVATFKNSHLVCETIRQCQPGEFMLETDSPYLAPEPYRGKRNEPSLMSHTATFIAELRGERLADLGMHTSLCAADFFQWRLDPIE